MKLPKSYVWFVLLVLCCGLLAAIRFWGGREGTPPPTQSPRSTPAQPSASDTPAGAGTSFPANPEVGGLAVAELPAVVGNEDTQEEISADLFYLQHDAGYKQWPLFGDVEAQLQQEVKAKYLSGETWAIDQMVQDAHDLLEQFWSSGDLGNPEGWNAIYKARVIAAEAVRATGFQDERALNIAGDCLISVIQSMCPYSRLRGNSADPQCQAIKQDAEEALYLFAVGQYGRSIQNLPLKDVTAKQLAVANRILQLTSSPIPALMAFPEVRKIVGVDVPSPTSAEQAADVVSQLDQLGEAKLNNQMQTHVAKWMLQVCEAKGWPEYKQEIEVALSQLEHNSYPGNVRFFSNSLVYTDRDKPELHRRYERFLDGFGIERDGRPIYEERRNHLK